MHKILLLDVVNLSTDCYECGHTVDVLRRCFDPIEVSDEEYSALRNFSKFKVVKIVEPESVKNELEECLKKQSKFRERKSAQEELAQKRKARLEKNKIKNLKKQKEKIEQKIRESLSKGNTSES